VTYLTSAASTHKSKAALLVAVFVSAFVLGSSLASWTQTAQANERVMPSHSGPIVIREFKHDTGPLLREIAPSLPEIGAPPEHEIENNVNPNHHWSNQVQKDPVLQTEENSPRLQTPNFSLEFDGAGFGDSLFCNCMPPDNDGAVGTTQYVQFINAEYRVFDKSGNTVLGPLFGKAFWAGFGGECESENNGDPVLRFDAAAERWVVSQFALGPSGGGPFYECIAVSTTADATGSYNRYAFQFAAFPDYPKLGVWPDAYYFTFNNFPASGPGFVGADVCAADRNSMLAGAAATLQCFQQNSSQFGMLPSDLDGSIPPAAGTPNFVIELDPSGSANLDLFQFHVDFTTPANSTFTGPTLIPVAAFTPLCNSQYRGECVPQPTAGSDLLESLGDRLMWRLVYRNFIDHTTLLVSHSIVAGSSGGVRWYEIRNPETSPTVFQSGTFAPDSQYRWMPAIAMDANQDIAVGFSRSGAAAGQYPSIVYAGRVPTDPAGTLESEVVLVAGLGSQTGGADRWGDYSSVTVDPTDDCTFWFTEEYEKTTGSFNWSTAIGTFSFPGCTANGTPTIASLSPASGAVGASVTITGANFGATQGTSTVAFNGTTATAIASWSAASIVATVPAGATTGNVVVTASAVNSNGSPFTVVAAPAITSLSPTSAAVGASVTITGTNFGATQGASTIAFNGTTATAITSWSATSIVATLPAGATTGNVVVNASGVNSNGSSFTVLPPPSITSLSPTSGVVSASVTIAGANFGATQGTSAVTFNGTTATAIASWSAASIVAAVPAGAATGNVVVNASGANSNGFAFTVVVVPTINWTQPAAITYGATLSGVLNASAVNGSTPVNGSFAYAATPQGGSASAVTDATVLGAGSYTLAAAFTPADTTNYTSASGSVSLTVAKAAPTNALGSSANEVLAKTAVTFTATVSSTAGTASGSVRFYDGTTLLGSAVALAQGVATYTTSSLADGSRSITAAYGGDSNFSALTSSVVTETVDDFTAGVATGSSAAQTVSPGGTATYALNVVPSTSSTFLSAITLAVSGAPAGAIATFTPPSLAAGAGATNVSLKIQVPGQTASLSLHRSGLLALGLSPFMLAMLLPLRGKIRQAAGKCGRSAYVLLLILAGTLLAGLLGCGGVSSAAPNIYTMTVTATSGTLSHSTTLTLQVK
jgi:hypothetical protein